MRLIPTFAMYKKIDLSENEEPRSYVTFMISERIQRVI